MMLDERVFSERLRIDNQKTFLKMIEDYEKSIAPSMRAQGYKRINQKERTVIFSFGEVTFARSRWKKGDSIRIPVDEKLGLEPRERFSRELLYEITVLATYMPYRKVVEVMELLRNILFQLKIDQEKCLSELSIINHNNQLFFDFRYGIPSNSAINKSLKRLLRQLSIDSTLTATGARHTYGSYLLAKGVDIWVVSRLMGHKDITQLIETYGHVLSEVINKEHEVVRDLIT